ncbi:MAG: bifunctional glutamate N-acetyltransferase/amino-acid acetyltransferase ArgJ [Nitrospirae bacterium]|nr:MAG: bifunctional glutamate N-acetyltransferase/amino-acid acetyltransferase ArgJ [Nitrospirota bacterium]
MTTGLDGGITAVPGMLAAGMAAGIKKGDVLDLALIVSEREATVAGVFTLNKVVAAPVILARQRLHRGKGRAILVNSGNANACTGRQGYADAVKVAALTAKTLRLRPEDVFVASTGVIGKPLPRERIEAAIPVLASQLRRDGGEDAARAIMTTDTTVKMAAASDTIGGHTITLGGIAKGSGMIHPNMATMLAFLATDAALPRAILQRGLRQAADRSFNRIPVDGDTSTNDMVLCLANGAAGNRPITPGSADARRFQALLDHVCLDLAKKIAWDGEGATKCVELRVQRARTTSEAVRIAVVIATSSLVKTAWFGEDANWGRIMAAIGRAGGRIAPDRIAITYGDIPVVRRGTGLGQAAEERANSVLKGRAFTLTVDLGIGHAEATVWTTDLSPEYVKINASYRS